MAGEWHDWPSNITGIGTFMQFADSSTNGYLGIMILIAVFVITFVVLKSNSSTKALAASSFISFIISVMLYRMELIDVIPVMVVLFILVVSVLLVRSESDRYAL